jgi:heterodisulfide reductase subunit B2
LKIGYYPGCSLSGTGKEYDLSIRKVLEKLDVELDELNDWSCCGATSAHATNHFLSIGLSAVNLFQAQNQKIDELFAPCAACYNRMVVAKDEFDRDTETAKQLSALNASTLKSQINVINIIQLFEKIGIDRISAAVKNNLKGIKAACYYGCLLVRPFNITHFDDSEQPESMEKIISACGAEPVDWNYKVECCGGAHSIAHKEIVVDLSKKIIDNAILHGADVIIVACPMCHSNLDMRQLAMKMDVNIPVLYLTEFIGLALGINSDELGLNLHFTKTKSFLEKVLVKE